jgi:hypothetical protein
VSRAGGLFNKKYIVAAMVVAVVSPAPEIVDIDKPVIPIVSRVSGWFWLASMNF